MMKNVRAYAILVFAAVTLGCAHKNPPPDFAFDHTASFANLESYAWHDDPTWEMPQGNSIVDGRFIDEHVRQAVEADLKKKGLEKVEGGSASMYLAYHTGGAGVVSQDKWGVSTWWSWAYVGYAGTKYRKQGNLVLDVRDRQKKLVWRGARTAMIGTNPEELALDIDRAVALLLAEFPPTKEAK